MTLKQKIEAIKALEDKISAGPWKPSKYDMDDGIDDGLNNGIVYATSAYETAGFSTIENRDFCVLSRNTIFELIDALKEAKDLISMFHQITEYQQDHDRCGVWLSKYNGGE